MKAIIIMPLSITYKNFKKMNVVISVINIALDKFALPDSAEPITSKEKYSLHVTQPYQNH
jgi:hypothetical protein